MMQLQTIELALAIVALLIAAAVLFVAVAR